VAASKPPPSVAAAFGDGANVRLYKESGDTVALPDRGTPTDCNASVFFAVAEAGDAADLAAVFALAEGDDGIRAHQRGCQAFGAGD
jgi:hypothetical protein